MIFLSRVLQQSLGMTARCEFEWFQKKSFTTELFWLTLEPNGVNCEIVHNLASSLFTTVSFKDEIGCLIKPAKPWQAVLLRRIYSEITTAFRDCIRKVFFGTNNVNNEKTLRTPNSNLFRCLDQNQKANIVENVLLNSYFKNHKQYLSTQITNNFIFE